MPEPVEDGEPLGRVIERHADGEEPRVSVQVLGSSREVGDELLLEGRVPQGLDGLVDLGDEVGAALDDEHGVDCLIHLFLEARHVHALLVGVEVDRAEIARQTERDLLGLRQRALEPLTDRGDPVVELLKRAKLLKCRAQRAESSAP